MLEWNGSQTSSRDRNSLWSDDRGQTLQDYVLGVSLFLLTVLVVVGTILPTVTAPFDQEVGGDKISQADRVAETIVSNASTSGGANRLNTTIVEEVVDKAVPALRERYSLPKTSGVNITVVSLDGNGVHRTTSGTQLASDASPEGSDAATSARIVTLSDESCSTACRLVVRIW